MSYFAGIDVSLRSVNICVVDNDGEVVAYLDEREYSINIVGYVTALTFKAGVDDPSRLKQSRTVAAHFGLTPGRLQSGELDIEGRHRGRQKTRRHPAPLMDRRDSVPMG